TLRYLEERVNAMIETWSLDGRGAARADAGPRPPDAHLLNGPSLEGISQDDVDALLADLNALPQPLEARAAAAPAAHPSDRSPAATGS
ncbi:MAG: hypothetical protein JO010_10325, partial [Alphaproteobacteria bacterium]|nr:hypothetical protein [Alphaproteobacteria bacterium]